ncbi:MAG: DEAD/DEAH box helicase, partial [Rhodospirillales bacterium]|nr:DEAD/DEAH box helicase [Acetobacter sp.]
MPHTLWGENTLILAATGSGKTFAAFLSVLSELASQAEQGSLPNALSAIYVSPLKALDNDIERNLAPALAAVNEALPLTRRIRMEVRTGDTDVSERSRQGRKRPHLILTTPETLSSILSQKTWREDGFAPRTVIVDEIHAFAESKRGSLLALCLERLEHRVRRPIQRIGISATAWPLQSIQGLLCGDRPCAIAKLDVAKGHRLNVVAPAPGTWLPPAGYNPFRIAPTVAQIVEQNQTSLIFVTTRSGVERLGLALTVLLPDLEERIAVHHGSVNREVRRDIEEGLKAGDWKAVVASSSLELGVDYQSVDRVILVGTPRGVSLALQRLGRSGHRVNGIAQGTLVPLSLPDLVECVALQGAATAGRLDALRVPNCPLDVLAQVLLGMSIEGDWDCGEAFQMVRKAGPYRDLTKADFDAVLTYLAGGGKVLGPYGTYGKIVVHEGKFRVADNKTTRNYYLNVGVIGSDIEMNIVSNRNRRLGAVEEAFIASLQPNEAFIMGGRAVRVKYVHSNTAVVEPAQGEQIKTPRWIGNKMPLTAQMATEELALRRHLRCVREQGGDEAACSASLQAHFQVDANVADRLARFVARHCNALPVPTDSPVLVERISSGRSFLLLVHIVAGRAINRSLAWVTGARLSAGRSVVANFDDHSFLLSLDARTAIDAAGLHEAFNPEGWISATHHETAVRESIFRSPS